MTMAVNRLVIIVTVGFFSLCNSDPATESKALLKLKSSFTITDALSSWVPGSSPCGGSSQWKGIICNNGAVSGLNLQAMGLSGSIDVTALRSLHSLRIIGLANNSFAGPIPELSALVSLRAIYLSDNQFSGEIPSEYFSQMTFLKKLRLSNNNLAGNLPSSIETLSRLVELKLARNRFTGRIPTLDGAPNLISLDLSHNAFEGEVPASLAARFAAPVFAGNPGLCGEGIGRECGIRTTDSKKVVATAITLAVLIVSVAAGLIVWYKRKIRDEDGYGNCSSSPGGAEASVEVHVGSLNKKEMETVRERKVVASSSPAEIVMVREEKGVVVMADLMKASAEVLGVGAMGSSYKAVMANGVAVVVKRIKDMSVGETERFDDEIRRLASVNHWNVLSPLAYHYRKEEKLVVSEYVPNGSLLYLLHGDHGSCHTELNWPLRLKIVLGIAKGLAHIHAQLGSLELPHGNLKSSNVLLGPDLDPLISDYGFAHLINPAAVSTTMFAYKSPEAAAPPHRVSPKSDIYCLGVVILEVLTGKFPSHYLSDGKGGIDVVRWAASAVEDGREAELLDPEIAGERGAATTEMQRMIGVGVACADADPAKRPSAARALRMIEEIGGGDGDVTKLMQVLPSLRDGYADSVVPAEATADSIEDSGEVSDRRKLTASDSYAFSVS